MAIEATLDPNLVRTNKVLEESVRFRDVRAWFVRYYTLHGIPVRLLTEGHGLRFEGLPVYHFP